MRAQPLGQRQVLALAQCHEAALAGLLQQLHQPLQAEHPRVVNLHLAIHREPVTPARQRHLHALRGHRGHAYGLAAWPVQAGHGRQPWQHLQRVQGLFGIVQQPGGITFVGIGQEGQGLEHLCQVRLLGVQGALGGELQTLVHGEQPRTSVPWLHHRPEAPERPRQQAQLQRVTPGHQLSDQACIARHALARCCVAVQLEVARQHAQRGVQLRLGVHRHGPALAHQLGHPALSRGDADQPCAVLAVAQHAQRVAPLHFFRR